MFAYCFEELRFICISSHAYTLSCVSTSPPVSSMLLTSELNYCTYKGSSIIFTLILDILIVFCFIVCYIIPWKLDFLRSQLTT